MSETEFLERLITVKVVRLAAPMIPAQCKTVQLLHVMFK